MLVKSVFSARDPVSRHLQNPASLVVGMIQLAPGAGGVSGRPWTSERPAADFTAG